MGNSVTQNIANDARNKFIDYITSTLNTMYYIHNKTEMPVSDYISIKDFGLDSDNIIIPSHNPEYMDDIVAGVRIVPKQNRFVVNEFLADGFSILCEELGIDQLYSVSLQFENKFNKIK